MPVSFACGSFQKSGSQSYPVSEVISVGFTPKAMMLFGIANGTTALTNFEDIERPGFGWTTGATENFSLSWGSDDKTGTESDLNTNTFRRARNDYCYTHGSASSGAYPQLRCTGFSGNDANFEYDLNDTGTYRTFWVAVGGSDITRVKAGEFNALTGTQSVTGVGFQPTIVFFLTGNSPNNPATSTPHLSLTFGVAKSTTQRGVFCTSAVDEVNPSDSHRYQRTDKCIAFFTEGSATIDAEADIVSMDSDGFTIQWSNDPTVSRPIYYLAIQGGTWNVGSFFTRTDADGPGTQTISGLQGTPKGLMLFGPESTTLNTVQIHSKFAFGAAASTTSSVRMDSGNLHNTNIPSSFRSYDAGTASTNVFVYKSHSAGSVNVDNALDPTNEANDLTSAALFQSFASGAFTINWTETPLAAENVFYVTVGDNLGQSLTKFVNESSTLTEAVVTKKLGQLIRELPDATLTLTETVVKKLSGQIVRVVNDTALTLGETLVRPTTALRKWINESLTVDEEVITLEKILRRINESLTLTETVSKRQIIPTATIQATAFQLRYSGGTGNSSSTASRGGAMSNTAVTDDLLNASWDDVSVSQSASGSVEYRCFYVYNSSATYTAYNCEMWIDSNTAAGDTISIGIGTAAMGGTEQGALASESTAPSGVSFSTAPDENSAIFLGDIPPTTGRSIWIKRDVPANTLSLTDNRYTLRMSFYSNNTAT